MKKTTRTANKNASPAPLGQSVSSHTAIVEIPIDRIVVDNVRREIHQDVMSNLISSINVQGLQMPLQVTPTLGRTYILVAGYLRLEALKALGRRYAPCFVLCYDAAVPSKWSDNVIRSQLDALTNAEHLVNWVRWSAKREKDLRERNPKSRRPRDKEVQVATRIAAFGSTDAARRKNFQRAKKIVDLPEEVKEAARANNLHKNASILRKIAACGSRSAQLKAIKNIVEERSQKPVKRIGSLKAKKSSPRDLGRAVVDDELSGNYSALEQAWRGSAFARVWENSSHRDRMTFCEEYLEIRLIQTRTDASDDDDEIGPTATNLSERRFITIKNQARKSISRSSKIDQWRPRETRKVVW